MRIRMKVGLALGIVVLCIGVGVGVMHFVENLGWLDSFYLSVMSVTTVGYGDRAFKSMTGRIFASIWLLVLTLAVAQAFLYLAEARVDKRLRKMAKWVLGHDMTVSEFLAADIDNNGFVRNPTSRAILEFVRSAENDQICYDHFAFRTFGVNGYGIESMAKFFLDFGYTTKKELRFPAKKLRALWFSPPKNAVPEGGSGISGPLPRIFISELLVDQMSLESQVT